MAGSKAAMTIEAGKLAAGWGPVEVHRLRALYEPLRRFAAVIGRWDVEPDDLVQDAYTKVLLRPPGEIADLGAYLRRTIANLATNERRRSRRADAARRRLGGDVAAVDPYPSELMELMRLDAPVRALLFLVDVEGEQIAEAAATVGMSPAAARMALTRARRKLRAEMSMESNGD